MFVREILGFGLGLGTAGALGITCLLGGHYVSAFRNHVRETVIKAVPKEIHNKAALEAIERSESKLVAAQAESQKELAKLEGKKEELRTLKSGIAELTSRLLRAKDLLSNGKVSTEDRPLLSNEIRLLSEVLSKNQARVTAIENHIRNVEGSHEKIASSSREFLAKLDQARLDASQNISKQHTSRAKELVSEAESILETIRLDNLVTLDRQEVLDTIRSPILSTPLNDAYEDEDLIKEIDRVLAKR
jgi:hypothetical protein